MWEVLHITVTESDSVEEPVDLPAAKAWAQVDHDDDDELIESMIPAARYEVEQMTNRKLVEHTVEISVSLTCAERFTLPYGKPTDLTLFDSDDEEIDETDYLLRGSNLKIPYLGEYRITYTVGESTPALNELVKMLVAFRYNHRGDNAEATLPEEILQRAAKHRLPWL